MFSIIDPQSHLSLEHYALDTRLAGLVRELRDEARLSIPKIRQRRVWMINSTAKGGGVAEMLPKLIQLVNELGVKARWGVISPSDPRFFSLTKRLHNAIHGDGVEPFTEEDRKLYDAVSLALFEQVKELIAEDDIVVIHDPQPAGLGALLKQHLGVKMIWRCHIGLDEDHPMADSAWEFLKPYLTKYDHAVFSAPAYIVPYLAKRVSIIAPSIDPLGHKNRSLHPVKLAGVLCNAGLMIPSEPVVTPAFVRPVGRLAHDGVFHSLDGAREVGLLYRPVVSQISRWDRLKGWLPLMAGFVQLKEQLRADLTSLNERQRSILETVRLVLAGPEPEAVQDDPEAIGVLDELREAYSKLTPELQKDIAILSLPMDSIKFNALVVNALQRSSNVVVQNSIREGFGLVVTEAMWKKTPVVGSSAYGITQQIKPGIDGLLIADPDDPSSVYKTLLDALIHPKEGDAMAQNAHRRVYRNLLIFRQIADWLRLLSSM